MPIKIKHKDPKSTDFGPNDIVINIKTGDVFYVGSKDGSSYFTFSLTEGTRVVANLNQQGFGKGATAGTAGSVADTNASFFPSPAIVDLPSSQVFIESYNPQIPGNSGSLAGLTGGHPKLNMGSTASLDFFFPSFKLAGTPPTTASSIPVYVALSGSDFGGSNDDFQSYNDLTASLDDVVVDDIVSQSIHNYPNLHVDFK